MATRIQLRRGTASEWTASNPTLSAGELGFETDTGKFKIGNGSSLWNALDYFLDSSELSSQYATQDYVDEVTSLINIEQVAFAATLGTWTTSTSNFGTSVIFSVAYGNGIWVAGGDYAQLRTSTNAITWTTRTSNFDENLNIFSVAYGNGIWVAGGYYGQLRTSTDAITWTTRTSNFEGERIYSVAYGNGTWVAGGDYGQIRTSTDAITWTTRTSNFGTSQIYSVAYGNGLWVAGGSYGQLKSSTDAITWTTRTSNFGTSQIRSVAYGNGTWVAGGFYGQLRSSTEILSTSYILQLSDNNSVVEMNNANANTITIPLNSSVAFPIGSNIDIVQTGAGQTTITPEVGVTIRSSNSETKLTGQYSGATIYKRGTNEWVLFGDLSA